MTFYTKNVFLVVFNFILCASRLSCRLNATKVERKGMGIVVVGSARLSNLARVSQN
jgi:hypothetical protein